MMDSKKVTALLRKEGFKVTPQRLAIYNVLCNTKSHPNAEMIFNKLQPYYPTMSLATIYKTIDILREIGLIQVINLGDDSLRYDAVVESHPHIRCTECGKIDDIMDFDFTASLKEAAAKTSYEISGQQFYFYGVCPECQAKNKLKIS
ncbi:Fur family transcriptional regulator [Pectinatus frisingensis]|uniref:Fur family transcriptional regulator n=1 Tax=Pectinatus frisingensis TaxID=865 RepID=UPI0018C4A6FF|nr:Fur family transcriptional regulator [Pectinatus frisingensis]